MRGVFGVFYVVLLDAFGWTRAATAGAISLSLFFEGLSFPFVGSLSDRLGARKTLILGGFILVLGLGLSATISSLWELYLWVGLVTALGLGLIGMVPHVANLSREFSKNRGMVLGLAYAGGGFGTFLFVPLSQLMIDTRGWAAACVGLAVITGLLVIPPAQILFKPVSGRPVARREAGEMETEWTVRQALSSSLFWLLFISRVLASMGNQIVVTHQIAHTVDVGYTKLFAASIFGFMGLSSVFGRVLFGYLTDRMRRETVFTCVQTVSSLGIVALLALQDNSLPVLLYAFALLYGLGQGSRALVLSAISADLFLGRNFGAIYGYFTLSIVVGGAFGAWLGGFLYDVSGSYIIAFLVSLGCFFASSVCVWVVQGKPKPLPPQ
ncbi:MAG: MFS transporter [Deltaproteobacteria bacterium]|nr:MFS transporter [Deltaproteobacteria bacterium]